ncbi:MAG: nuclear transport factor 2 family protein [Sagittula sp.]|uniref:nuclear transport factor 2 family protein n=1 Tax=Sagittula sp. TaxID=2038081 RepID=UPI004058624D
MQTNRDRAEAFYAAVARGDSQAAAAFVHVQDLKLEEAPDLPFGGTYRGVEGFHALFARMGEIWKRAAVVDLSIMAEADTAIAQLALDVISRRTGERARLPMVEVCRFDAAGLIVGIRPYYFYAHAVWKAAGLSAPS